MIAYYILSWILHKEKSLMLNRSWAACSRDIELDTYLDITGCFIELNAQKYSGMLYSEIICWTLWGVGTEGTIELV